MSGSSILERAPTAGTVRPKVDRPHVVVADDDPTMRDILSRYLTHCGFDVSTCETSEDVICVLERSVVDMLITDLSMPEDGLDVIRRVREQASDLPIIVVTGRPISKGDEDFIAMNVTEIFEKPTKLDRLARTAGRIAAAQRTAPRPA